LSPTVAGRRYRQDRLIETGESHIDRVPTARKPRLKGAFYPSARPDVEPFTMFRAGHPGYPTKSVGLFITKNRRRSPRRDRRRQFSYPKQELRGLKDLGVLLAATYPTKLSGCAAFHIATNSALDLPMFSALTIVPLNASFVFSPFSKRGSTLTLISKLPSSPMLGV